MPFTLVGSLLSAIYKRRVVRNGVFDGMEGADDEVIDCFLRKTRRMDHLCFEMTLTFGSGLRVSTSSRGHLKPAI